MNIPSYNMLPFDAVIEIQSLIRQAIDDDTDTAARVLDDLLTSKPKRYRATALTVLHTWIHPYSTHRRPSGERARGEGTPVR